MIIGAHTSASGGTHKAIARAIDDECEGFQLFTKNNNRWAQRMWTDQEAQRFRDSYAASGLRGLASHTSYLINLCSSKAETVEKSIDALADELDRCALLGIPYLVMHPGSHVGQGEDRGIELICENLELVYEKEAAGAWSSVTLLFENTAGQGTNLGWSLDHLEALFDGVHDPARFGVCFDTCHAHAAGIDLTTPDGYEAFWSDFDEVVGIDRIGVFHLNDSKRELGSRVDRHENIGEGEIGEPLFKRLMNDPRFTSVLGILETPAINGSYKTDVLRLIGLREEAA